VTRELSWAGCANVRDLGGVPIEGGGETRAGVFVRADNVGLLTHEGWASLVEHGVERIVDLRWQQEVAEDPPRDVDIEVTHVSLLGTLDASMRDEIDDYLPDDVAGYRAQQYAAFLDRYRPEFGRVFAALAEPTDGAVVFHCSAGKDRTGLIAALLLRLAGVSIEDAAEDYALSEEGVMRLFGSGADSYSMFLLKTPADAMARTLETLGDVEAYLRSAGLTGDQIERLRSRLVAA